MIQTIYVAGPYTKGSLPGNLDRALVCGNELMDLGLIPLVPHLSYHMNKLKPRGYEDWMVWCLVWVGKCDAVLRMPGDSPGADREVQHALNLKIPVFFSVEELKQYLKERAIYEHVVEDM